MRCPCCRTSNELDKYGEAQVKEYEKEVADTQRRYWLEKENSDFNQARSMRDTLIFYWVPFVMAALGLIDTWRESGNDTAARRLTGNDVVTAMAVAAAFYFIGGLMVTVYWFGSEERRRFRYLKKRDGR